MDILDLAQLQQSAKELGYSYFIKENTWLNRTYLDFGWGNGYVVVPPSSKFYRVEYEDVEIEAYKGLTWTSFAGDINHGVKGIPDDYWVIGFDTAHGGDNLENCNKDFVRKETYELLIRVIKEDLLWRTVYD